MVIGTATLTLSCPWAESLKDKRMVLRSIIDRCKKFNISIAEIAQQDVHKTIVIGIACVTNQTAHANSILNHVITFIENHTDALLVDVQIELL